MQKMSNKKEKFKKRYAKNTPTLVARRFAGFDISYYLLPWISSNVDD